MLYYMSEKYVDNGKGCIAAIREIFTQTEIKHLLENGDIDNLYYFNPIVISKRNIYFFFGKRFVKNPDLIRVFREPTIEL